jgi:hypothetical protein
VLTLVISFVFTGHGLLSREQPRTTPENIEGNVRVWSDVSLPGGIILAVPKSFKISGDGDWRRERHSRWRDNLALIVIACLFVGLFLWLAIQKFFL